jgi:hypothetical protein
MDSTVSIQVLALQQSEQQQKTTPSNRGNVSLMEIMRYLTNNQIRWRFRSNFSVSMASCRCMYSTSIPLSKSDHRRMASVTRAWLTNYKPSLGRSKVYTQNLVLPQRAIYRTSAGQIVMSGSLSANSFPMQLCVHSWRTLGHVWTAQRRCRRPNCPHIRPSHHFNSEDYEHLHL